MALSDSGRALDLQRVSELIVLSGPGGHVSNGPTVLAGPSGAGTGSNGHVRGQTPDMAVSDKAGARD
jgi:hypothetical protein